MAKKPVIRDVNREVRNLRYRVDSMYGIQRMMADVQWKSLRKAEEIRRLARDVVKSQWQHRCSDKIGGCTAVSDSKLEALAEALKGLRPFHNPKAGMPPHLRAAMRKPKVRR